MKKIPVGVLGATGIVGQQYLQALINHPWFEVKFLASSAQSAGKKYGDAIANRSYLPHPLPDSLLNCRVQNVEDIDKARQDVLFVFSAMSNEGAKIYEEIYAAAGLPVISNASHHRMSSDIPVLIPEVNPDHAKIIPQQQMNRQWDRGFIAVKPNCSLQSYLIPLAPLHHRYKIKTLLITTLQALSGAGYPGVSSLDILDNVIPYIAHEEEKSEKETLKILGNIHQGGIEPSKNIKISAHCNRVGVTDGHLACVSVEFESKPSQEEILALWSEFQGFPQLYELPSSPLHPIIYRHEPNRPQPRLDRLSGAGMSVTVGRLRDCDVFHYRFTALSHNTIRGAAGGGILNAEMLYKLNYIKD